MNRVPTALVLLYSHMLLPHGCCCSQEPPPDSSSLAAREVLLRVTLATPVHRFLMVLVPDFGVATAWLAVSEGSSESPRALGVG